jgi:predicted DNA-binding protein (MmcQ/YjbR family)
MTLTTQIARRVDNTHFQKRRRSQDLPNDSFNNFNRMMLQQIDFLRQFALSLPETTEDPHFEKTSFRVRKKIFATYDEKNNRACLKLSEIDQDVFSTIDKAAIYPVPNKWGKQGWTLIELDKLGNEVLEDALKKAYSEVAPKKLSDQINRE